MKMKSYYPIPTHGWRICFTFSHASAAATNFAHVKVARFLIIIIKLQQKQRKKTNLPPSQSSSKALGAFAANQNLILSERQRTKFFQHSHLVQNALGKSNFRDHTHSSTAESKISGTVRASVALATRPTNSEDKWHED